MFAPPTPHPAGLVAGIQLLARRARIKVKTFHRAKPGRDAQRGHNARDLARVRLGVFSAPFFSLSAHAGA